MPTVKLPRVVVPIPPFDTASKPLTSAEPRLIEPLYKAPAAVERTGKAWVKEDRVVDPLTVKVPVNELVAKKEFPVTVKPVDEAAANVVCPVTYNLPVVSAVEDALPNVV